MADQTYTPTSSMTEEGKALYDSIMREIEPELTTDQMPFLDEKYKDETPEQSQERGNRYQQAFAEYDKRLAALEQSWHEQMAAFKHNALKTTERDARSVEEQAMGSLEDQMQSA